MLYTRLGIEKNATPLDIKRAYHKLALRYHPDKNPQAEEQFKHIKEAYDILCDPCKRQIYDTQHLLGVQDDASFEFDEKFSEEFATLVNKFSSFLVVATRLYKEYKDVQKTMESEKGNAREDPQIHYPVIKITLSVTIEDLYKKRIKKVIVNTRFMDGTIYKRTLYVSLLNYQECYVFKDVGDEYEEKIKSVMSFFSPTKRIIKKGEVHIYLNIEKHPMLEIFTMVHPYDLTMTKKIGLFEYLYGCTFQITVFGERSITVNYPGGKPLLLTYEENGLPYYNEEHEEEHRGSFHVFLELVLLEPENIRIKELEEMNKTDLCELKRLLDKYDCVNNDSRDNLNVSIH